MRINRVKRLLKEGKPTIGTWLSLGDVFAARVMARMGFDWLTLDLEHAPIDLQQASIIFGAIAESGCVPLARVPNGKHDHIKRVLDAGAFGIVVPMVDTVEQAITAIRAAKYPPTGNRSLGGSLSALNFQCSSTEYFSKANDEILVVLQTESPLGIANAESIYAQPGVDAIFVGPVDLRAQMRHPDGSEASEDAFQNALQQVVEIGKKTGTPTGMHVMDAHSALVRMEQGMQFLAVGSELRMMTERARDVLEQLDPKRLSKDTIGY